MYCHHGTFFCNIHYINHLLTRLYIIFNMHISFIKILTCTLYLACTYLTRTSHSLTCSYACDWQIFNTFAQVLQIYASKTKCLPSLSNFIATYVSCGDLENLPRSPRSRGNAQPAHTRTSVRSVAHPAVEPFMRQRRCVCWCVCVRQRSHPLLRVNRQTHGTALDTCACRYSYP